MQSPEHPLRALGWLRLRVLGCLGGDVPTLPQYLTLKRGEDVFVAFTRFVGDMTVRCASASDAATRALIGAARLLSGELSGAEEVLDHLPEHPVALDHGAGYCLAVPPQCLRSTLPLPEDYVLSGQWLAGSTQQRNVRAWISTHRGQLVWDAARCQYQFRD